MEPKTREELMLEIEKLKELPEEILNFQGTYEDLKIEQ